MRFFKEVVEFEGEIEYWNLLESGKSIGLLISFNIKGDLIHKSYLNSNGSRRGLYHYRKKHLYTL